jgi:hypothetical protein
VLGVAQGALLGLIASTVVAAVRRPATAGDGR